MLNSAEDFLTRIDNLIIYEKDYHTLNSMLELDHNLFIKILEELLLGTIYISDLETMFENNSYKDILSNELKNQEILETKQKNLIDKLKRMSSMKNALNNIEAPSNITKITISKDEEIELSTLLNNFVNGSNQKISHGVITLEKLKNLEPFENKDRLIELVVKKLNSEIYEKLRVERRDALFYELMQRNVVSESDPIIKNLKFKFFRMLEAGYIVEDMLNSNEISFEIINDGGINKVIFNDGEEILNFIMPDDFLFSVDDPIIPINFEDVQLNEHDREYMCLKNLSQEEMKKMKSLYLSLMKENFLRKNLKIYYNVD